MVKTALKNQLVSVFEGSYLYNLKNLYTGYATKITLALLTHLYTNYACISATYVAASNKNILSQYKLEDPLEGIIERLNEYADFAAAASEPVTDTQIFHITYELVVETGHYP